jgi:transposase InsO family protein
MVEPPLPAPGFPEEHVEGTGIPRFYKLSFPTFDGKEDPTGWLNRCEHFFRAQHTRECDKVWLASFHMTGDAQHWYFMLERDEGAVDWERFQALCQQRFGPAIGINHLAELARLPFKGSVEEYQVAFQARMAHAGYLSPEQQVQLFTGGLPDTIRIDVELQFPQDLQRAMALARAYERRAAALVPAATRPARPPQRPQHQPLPPASTPPQALVPATQASTPPKPFRRLSPAEMTERRRQGLCYNCDEQYVRGHRCPRLFYLEVADFVDDNPNILDAALPPEEDEPLITLNAITGIRTEDTMQLQTWFRNTELTALVDSGSTCNFISLTAARRIGISCGDAKGASVRVANGDRVVCSGLARAIAIRIGDEVFEIDCYAIPLACYDMVLGVPFLRALGPILWDFDGLCMAFWRHGRRVQWTGVGSARGGVPAPGRLHMLHHDGPALLQRLLGSFADVFAAPVGLPPPRECDHRIHLKPNTEPVAVRPYRYPHLQKDELEAQCTAMLDQGIIRPSSSPFSAPVLLVKKADGSWRFCVDYRALNSCTVKDKFPIPVVEELLDELHGAKFFSKLDLRSGYHQVRVAPEDIHKTAFRTHHGHFEFLVMPFGLSNAPATFQALMNAVLHPFLRRGVLVFFDDILIYSASWTEHLLHLRTVLEVLRANNLHVKHSKCSFATTTVEYLGHVISADGVAMDRAKVEAVAAWPQPRSPRGLRGFLGLAGYYRRFIKGFGAIAEPLTKLLRKDAFQWSEEAAVAFAALKNALTTAPVLQLPDFSKEFFVDCDASGAGFGAVLHQGDGALAFFSKQFAPRHLKVAAYERELIGLVQAVRHWRPYLWGRPFVVRTDHYALKFMLDQRLSTIPQHQWISKLFGFDFRVEFQPGRLNTVADALSRRDTEELGLAALSSPSFKLFDELRQEIRASTELSTLRAAILAGQKGAPWTVVDDLILRDGKVFVQPTSPLLAVVLQLAHAGHEGTQKTLHRLRADFYIEHDRRTVLDFVRSCSTCQRNKVAALQPAGLLQPLPVPSRVWADISMDFIEALPKVHGKSVILTVVDRFSKYAHFIPLGHPYTAHSVARAFFHEIVRLHGIPESIVSDRDPVFTSSVWRELFQLAGVKLKMSTAFHPQTDGQSEAVNKTIAMYLRCTTGDRPRAWLDWLPWAELCYNTSFHSALKATPFEVVYGRPPPALLPYQPGSAASPGVDAMLSDRDMFLAEVRERLLQAQEYARWHYDAHHRQLEFQVGDWVWLRMLHRPTQSLHTGGRGKLGPRYAGPFQVLERIGTVAYRLQLPTGARIHDVFHVGVLKPFQGEPPVDTPLLPPTQHGRLLSSPERVLRAERRQGVWHVLVCWAGLPEAAATWEPLPAFRAAHPSFQLEDELFVEGGRIVTSGNVFYRKNKRGG